MRYTGIKDRHGMKIFEKDILRVWKEANNIIPTDHVIQTVVEDARYIDHWKDCEVEVVGNRTTDWVRHETIWCYENQEKHRRG